MESAPSGKSVMKLLSVLSSASVRVLLSAPVPRSASDEGFVRATLLRQVEPIINNFSITEPGTDEPQ